MLYYTTHARGRLDVGWAENKMAQAKRNKCAEKDSNIAFHCCTLSVNSRKFAYSMQINQVEVLH